MDFEDVLEPFYVGEGVSGVADILQKQYLYLFKKDPDFGSPNAPYGIPNDFLVVAGEQFFDNVLVFGGQGLLQHSRIRFY